MRLEKKLGLLALIVLLIALSGCSYKKGSDQPQSTQFVATGTEGLVMLFVDQQPPPKVYTGGPLDFLVEVRNRGTVNVDSAMFYLSGFDQVMVPITPNPAPLPTPLEGKTQFNPDGGYTTLQFSAQNLVLPPEMPNYRPNFLLTACYPYKTFATPMVCVDPNPQDTVSDKACIVQKSVAAGSQGAPVAVQTIETQATPRGMYFRINIANVGGGVAGSGVVYDMNSLGKCPGALDFNDLNKVKYLVSMGNSEPVTCQPANNEVRLVNGKATIFCQTGKSSQGLAYETPLRVELMYGYKSSIAKQVEIENLDFGRA